MITKLNEIFGGRIKLTNSMTVKTDKFSELFSDANELTYDELMRVEEENDYGYEKYIEEWKSEGLIE